MTAAEVLPGVWLDSRRALWIASRRLLVVADLHWGYAASHRVQGNLLPDWGDEALAATLRALEDDYRPATTVWLGDSLHTLAGAVPAETFLEQARSPTVVLAGNHDDRWLRGGRGLAPVRALPEWHETPGYFLHHGHRSPAVPAGAVEITGHHHPALGWNDRAGGRLKLPALVVSPTRLILPAFSPWASGTPWNDTLQPGETLYGITPRRLLAVPHAMITRRTALVT